MFQKTLIAVGTRSGWPERVSEGLGLLKVLDANRGACPRVGDRRAVLSSFSAYFFFPAA